MRYTYICLFSLITLFATSCKESDSQNFQTDGDFELECVRIDGEEKMTGFVDVNPASNIKLLFSQSVDKSTLRKGLIFSDYKGNRVSFDTTCSDSDQTVILIPTDELLPFRRYTITVQPTLRSANHSLIFSGKVVDLETGAPQTDRFPKIDDEALLTKIQQATFSYFWDYAHPVSGMARERLSTADIVTTGGTGFGIMAIIAAVERGFITRQEAVDKVNNIVAFLDQKVVKYHGAFPHWINGVTGETIPFSKYDDGADLVETALLFQGLLTAREYFVEDSADERLIVTTITKLWEHVEWNFFTRAEDVLYWHWSPNYSWNISLKVAGWNESLILYVLAASSPTYPISADVYHKGWARSGDFQNGNSLYGITLPLGDNYGGPLFFSHYSFLGLNPHSLKDRYADYFEQNRAHALINRAYAIANPKNYSGYSKYCWGLTAGDGDEGYGAFSPSNDRGVITPTAAIASIVYTPEESLDAIHFFYYKMGDKLWTENGFKDGFNLTKNWYSTDLIAINQGPIIVSIENYRTALLWNLFMKNPEIEEGLQVLGFY